MKSFKILLIALCLIAVSCGEKEEQQPKPADVTFSVSPTSLTIGAAGGELSFDVTSSTSPYVVGSFPWCTSNKSASGTNKTTVKLTVSENTTYEQRKAEFSVVCNDDKQIVTVTQDAAEKPVEPEPEDLMKGPELPQNTAVSMSKKLGLGWNLGNQMDAESNGVSGETVWGQPKCTQQTFDKLKEYGFTFVRIPITWIGHIGAAPDYKIDDEWMDRVAEIVGYCEKAGLICIINTHHDENHRGEDHASHYEAHWQDIYTASINAEVNTAIKAEIKAFWTQVAKKFASNGEFLIFESFNEINDGGWGYSDAFKKDPEKQTNILNEWNQVFVDAVRATGSQNANRWLGIPGYCANPEFTIKYAKLPKDSAEGRLMVGVHSYDPYEFCTQAKYSEWGHTGAYGKKPTYDETSLLKMFKSLYDNYIAKDIPCYIGEFGCVNRDDERATKFQKYYLEFFCKAARTYGLPCAVWDNGNVAKSGERFAYVNHGTGAYLENGMSMIGAMTKGMTTTTSNYTLTTVYNNAPK